MHMTILKHVLPFLGLATFIHAQEAFDSYQDFPIEETTPVVEETEEPTFVEVEAPAPTPTAKKPKAKAKKQVQQQEYISNELDYVSVSKSVMSLTLSEDDPADAPDSRDNNNISISKKNEDAIGENDTPKKGPFTLGLHFGVGYLDAETKVPKRSWDSYYYENYNSENSTETELGLIVALKNIVGNMFVTTGFYVSVSIMNFKVESGYRDRYDYYHEEDTHDRYSVNLNVPITVGYQIKNMVNLEIGTLISGIIYNSDLGNDFYNIHDEVSTGFILGASAVLGQKHEIGLNMKIKSDGTLFAINYNYWLF